MTVCGLHASITEIAQTLGRLERKQEREVTSAITPAPLSLPTPTGAIEIRPPDAAAAIPPAAAFFVAPIMSFDTARTACRAADLILPERNSSLGVD
jgi:hypothetical protein